MLLSSWSIKQNSAPTECCHTEGRLVSQNRTSHICIVNGQHCRPRMSPSTDGWPTNRADPGLGAVRGSELEGWWDGKLFSPLFHFTVQLQDWKAKRGVGLRSMAQGFQRDTETSLYRERDICVDTVNSHAPGLPSVHYSTAKSLSYSF